MKAIGAFLLLWSPWVWAQSWQVCQWQVQLLEESRPWQNQDLVAQTAFQSNIESGAAAAIEVSDDQQAWEVQAKVLDTYGPYTEPCRFVVGRTMRMLVWPDGNLHHTGRLQNVWPKGSVWVVKQNVISHHIEIQQLSGDEFYLQKW